jgi:uncharacterized membrane protein
MRSHISRSLPQRHRWTVASRGIVLASAALASSSAMAQTFASLGVLDTNHQFSQAVAVSSNGQHVAGNSGVGLFDQMRGFRWSQGSGMSDIGEVPESDFYWAVGISNDGNTVTGGYQSGTTSAAFRWKPDSGFELLQNLAGDLGAMGAGISADAQFVGGTSFNDTSFRAVRWNAAGTPEDLGTLPGAFSSTANAISGDGTTIVGESDYLPMVWTQASGMQPLPFNEGGNAFAVNFDGTVIAGYDGSNAARWTNGVLQILPNLAGGSVGGAYAVSGNGLLTGGFVADDAFNQSATVWSDSMGAVNLNTYLPLLGIDLEGWNLEICTAISFDGNTLVGQGNFNGETRAWLATIPSPSIAATLGFGGLMVTRRRRRHHR